MKSISLIIIGIIIPILCFGISEYQLEDKLFIWAESGLNLREKPNSKSKILIKIPFGKEVICKGEKSWNEYQNNSQKILEKVETFKGESTDLELKGTWVRVRYENQEGYVFDSYLSRFEPIPKEKEIMSLFEYFKKECDSLIYLEKKEATLESGIDKIVLSNGIFLTYNYASGGFWFQFNIPNCSTEEAFLIINYLTNYDLPEVIQREDGGIFLSDGMGGYEIENFKDIVIISGEWTC